MKQQQQHVFLLPLFSECREGDGEEGTEKGNFALATLDDERKEEPASWRVPWRLAALRMYCAAAGSSIMRLLCAPRGFGVGCTLGFRRDFPD